MKRLFAILAAIALGNGVEAANLTIAKNMRLDMGRKCYPLGAPTNLVNRAYPLNDGGYLVTDPFSTNSGLLRFTSTGALGWSNCCALPDPRLSAFAEMHDGRLAFLVHPRGDRPSLLFVIGADGVGLTQYPLPELVSPSYAGFTTLLPQTDGLLVGGLGQVSGSSYASCFVMSYSTNFDKEWQRDYVSMSMAEPKLASFHGGYVLASGGNGYSLNCTFAAVSTNGIVQWQRSINGNNGVDQIGALLPCRDGGLLIGFSSSSTPSGVRTAPAYGNGDIWLVKLDSSGNRVWDRSFGGVGQETLGWDSSDVVRVKLGNARQTEDGGFLIAGWTLGSQISGNKAVDGDGVWLLKLSSSGFKDSESVIESYGSGEPAYLLPAPQGYRLAVAAWILDLAVRRVIDISAASNGKAYRLDYSHDLLNWTNIVSRYDGSISLEEDMEPGHKFYRCEEMP